MTVLKPERVLFDVLDGLILNRSPLSLKPSLSQTLFITPESPVESM